MRCPKCHYLSFDPESRCRNCGFDFSFAEDTAEAVTAEAADMPADELPPREIERVVDDGPLADLELQTAEAVATIEQELKVPARRSAPRRPRAPRRASAPQAPASVAVATMEREPEYVAPAPTPAPAPLSSIPLSMSIVSDNLPEDPAPVKVPAMDVAPVAPVELALVETPAVPAAPEELPLFLQGPQVDDEPLVKVPAAPRQPLAVRRATPDQARMREYQRRAAEATPEPDLLTLERPNLVAVPDVADTLERDDDRPAPIIAMPPPAARLAAADARVSLAPPDQTPADLLQAAASSRRFGAALIDVILLTLINIGVVVLTLRQLGLGPIGLFGLPFLPLAGFLLALDAGYLLLFTATNGQTIGKMAAHVRVIGLSPEAMANDHITIPEAIWRTAATALSILTLGLGYLPAFFGDRRALHDRLAHTRVVRQ